MKRSFKGAWKRSIIIVFCLALIVARQIWPHLEFDSTNLWLLGIAAFLFLMPEPSILFPYIKRIKLWEAEVELKEEVKELGIEVEKAQESVQNQPGPEVTSQNSPDLEEIFRESSKDPKSTLLLLSAKLETEIRKRFIESGLSRKMGSSSSSTLNYLDMLVYKGFYSGRVLAAYKDFRGVRNKIAHDLSFDVLDSTILSVISIGTQLLKVLSVPISPETD